MSHSTYSVVSYASGREIESERFEHPGIAEGICDAMRANGDLTAIVLTYF